MILVFFFCFGEFGMNWFICWVYCFVYAFIFHVLLEESLDMHVYKFDAFFWMNLCNFCVLET